MVRRADADRAGGDLLDSRSVVDPEEQVRFAGPARRHLDVEDPWSDGLVRTEHLLPGPIDKNDLDGSLRQRREVVQACDVGVDHRRVPFRQGVDLGKDLEPLAESRDRPGLVDMIVFVGCRRADATE